METNGSARVIRFGAFEANLRTGELRRDGTRVPLQGQPFQVCALLLSNPGNLVTREELRQKIWPEDTFVDFDQALNTSIAKIRAALGDNSEHPRFIETLPRRGYRFIGAIDDASDKQSPSASIAPPPANRAAPGRVFATVGISLLLLIAAFEIWRFSRTSTEAALPALEVVPLVSLPGMESTASFSPDGNRVALSLHRSKDPGIYTTGIAGQNPQRLTSNPSDCCPQWSSDGLQIAFSRADGDGFDFYVIPAAGGAERRVASWPIEGHQVSAVAKWRAVVRCFDWSPDGKVLAFSDGQTDKTHAWISLLSLADSTTKQLTSPPSQHLDYGPAFSPDGASVAFVRSIAAGVVEDLYIVPASGGEPRRDTFDNAWMNAPPTWTPDGRDIVFTSMRGGNWALWRVAASGGTPRPVVGVGIDAVIPVVSPKGNLLAYQQVAGRLNIWRLNLKDEKHPDGQPEMLIPDKRGGGRPHYSPDGKRIAFESARLGFAEIWACDSDGSHCDQLTTLRGTAGAARWSPDGRYLAFEFRPKEHSEVFLLEKGDATPRLLKTLDGADNGGPSWSRDGKSIYFYSDRAGSFQLWKTQVGADSPVQVTRHGGVFAAESADGKFLYYSKFEKRGLWRMPLTGGEEVQVLDQPPGDAWWNWALTPKGIYFIENSRNVASSGLKSFEFATQKRISIAPINNASFGLAISPDGKSLLYGHYEPETEESNIMLVKNFR
jgi:Tol biopolymer transport system component/DNA-binding winged helix-turn-helix (wHTH) protein